MSLTNKVILITGASQGIGACLARTVHARGASCVLVARSSDKLQALCAELAGERVVAVTADVTIRFDHERALAAAVAAFGRVDVWVNNAGRGITRSVEEMTDEDFDDMMLVNTKSALYGMQTAVRHFKALATDAAPARGHVINVSSLLGRLPFASVRAAYCAAKHALNSLTCSMRVDMQNQGLAGIHVSLVSPGPVATDFGVNALHGGVDSRKYAGAQAPEEVAEVIAGVIERPRADVYTRDSYHATIAAYYSAESVELIESRPPFAVAAAPPAHRAASAGAESKVEKP